MTVIHGVQCFLRGARMASNPELRGYVWIPALVSLAVITTGLTFALSYVNDLSAYLIGLLPAWLDFLRWIIAPMLYLSGVLAGAWSFGLIAAVVGSPLLGELALRTERLNSNPTAWWQQLGPTLLREVRKLRYHLPRIVGLALISVLPGINTLAPFLWVGFGAWMMAVQFCDYSTENRLHQFADTLRLLRTHRAASLGFGLCVTLAMSVPVFNFIVAPVATVGATLLMQDFRSTTQ